MKWKNPVQLLLGLFESDPTPRKREVVPKIGPIEKTMRDSSDRTVETSPMLVRSSPLVVEGVVFEFPPRLRKTWRLVRRRGSWVCELPRVFEHAPEEIQMDLTIWVKYALRPSPGSRAKKKAAQVRIFHWLSPQLTEKVPLARGKGETWNLEELFEALNRSYFEGRLQAIVRWSPKVGGLSTHRKVDAGGVSHHVLTISRAYDGAGVPRVAVEGVLYHEMCHIAFPPRAGETGLRRHVHHQEFRKAERRYEGFDAWRQWEQQHLHRQLRILRKRLNLG